MNEDGPFHRWSEGPGGLREDEAPQMTGTLKRIQELEAQRALLNADIDRQIEGLKAPALQELDALRAQLAAAEAVLGAPITPREQRAPARATRTEFDETDAGNGVREVEDNASASSFTQELAQLRQRTQEKRRRLQ